MSEPPCAWIEEQALHRAALAFVRTRFQPLEVRMRVDRAREVARRLAEDNPLRDRVFSPEDLEDILAKAEELARLTLLHAGCKDAGLVEMPVRKTEVELLVEKIREEILKVRGDSERCEHPTEIEQAVFEAFSKIAALVEPEEDRK